MIHSTLTPLIAIAIALSATTAAYSDFQLPYMLTQQPNGAADGQEDYYGIDFNITSTNASPAQSAWCALGWSDNDRICGNTCVPYSTYVPTNTWTTCYANASSSEPGPFAFELFPYFSIGNFSIAVRENVTRADGTVTTLESSPYQITNASAAVYSCEIEGDEYSPVGQHARGDCSTPAGTKGFCIPVLDAM